MDEYTEEGLQDYALNLAKQKLKGEMFYAKDYVLDEIWTDEGLNALCDKFKEVLGDWAPLVIANVLGRYIERGEIAAEVSVSAGEEEPQKVPLRHLEGEECWAAIGAGKDAGPIHPTVWFEIEPPAED